MKYDVIYKEDLPDRRSVNGPEDVYKLLKEKGYVECRQERSLLITLDSTRSVIGIHIIHIGTANATITCARDIMYNAIMDNATEIVICHNHPSGSLEPSESDFKTATRMYKVGILHAINVKLAMVVSKYGFAIISPNFEEIERFKKEL